MSFWTRTGALWQPRSFESGSTIFVKHTEKVTKLSNCQTQPKALAFQSYIVRFSNSVLTPIASSQHAFVGKRKFLEVYLHSRRKGKVFECVKVLFLSCLLHRKKKYTKQTNKKNPMCNLIVKLCIWTENLKSGQR